MNRKQRRAIAHSKRNKRKQATNPKAKTARALPSTEQPPITPPQFQPAEAAKPQPSTKRLLPLRRGARKALAFALAVFGLIGTLVTIYAGRPFVTMSTSTQDDPCSFACSQFRVTNSSPFVLHDVTARCFPQTLGYTDEFVLEMSDMDTINPAVKNLESGEAMTVKCGYMLRHFVQPGLLLLSHGDPLDKHTNIIRIPVDQDQKPIFDRQGHMSNAPPIHGGSEVKLGRETALVSADVVFRLTFTSQLIPWHIFRQDRRFQLSMQRSKLDWAPVPLSDPPLKPPRTKPGFILQIAGSLKELEEMPTTR